MLKWWYVVDLVIDAWRRVLKLIWFSVSNVYKWEGKNTHFTAATAKRVEGETSA